MKKLLLAATAACALLAGGVSTASAADTTEVVTAADRDVPGGHWYSSDTRGTGTGTFENGPASPPLGTGSFEARTPDGTAKVQLFTDLYDGVRLADIDGIGYSTYNETSGVAMLALNMRVDLTGDGQPDAYFVYEPYQDEGNGAIVPNTWQDWDAYKGGSAKWWINTGAAGCGQATPCTWSFIVSQFPNATIEEGPNCGPGGVKVPCPGSFGLNQGSGNAGAVSNADALYLSVNGDKTTFDLERDEPMPTTKEQCKNGGWQSYGTTFKNQGDCISFVATQGKNEPGKNTK
jgi:hypothetical protein